MSDNGIRWWWDDGWSPSHAIGTVRIVDSWLVDEGRVRGFSRHAERFAKACSRFAGPGTDRFLRAVAESLPARGRWFPRVELVETGSRTRLRLWLRPAPPRTTTVRLWDSGPDRRSLPMVKGFDLDHLAALRAAAIAAGADEALLLSAEGHVLEGSATSILWWRGDTLCGPPPRCRPAARNHPGVARRADRTPGPLRVCQSSGTGWCSGVGGQRPARHPAGRRRAGPLPRRGCRAGRAVAVASGGTRLRPVPIT